jgi:hypothetical protein
MFTSDSENVHDLTESLGLLEEEKHLFVDFSRDARKTPNLCKIRSPNRLENAITRISRCQEVKLFMETRFLKTFFLKISSTQVTCFHLLLIPRRNFMDF